MISFENKHVLITGAGGGIGRVLATTFGVAGAVVSGFDANGEMLEGAPVTYRSVFDMLDAAATAAAVEALIDARGVPDILINNAGYTRSETLPTVDRDAWDTDIGVNLTGVFDITRPVVDGMVARGSGAVVFISSVNALGHYGNPAYSAAKAGILAYCRAIAVEYGKHGVRANAICPGSVRTRAWDHRVARDPAVLKKVTGLYPLGRMVEPQDVANAALFLASPLAAGITGVTLPVDAGLTAGSLPFLRDVLGVET
ncbi:MAG: SDR family oxidoreductase [Hyphomicrobiaceae bacterium]|nr:SDR family oxidoreductase [Hyphomicrobiaceae bacterium]